MGGAQPTAAIEAHKHSTFIIIIIIASSDHSSETEIRILFLLK